MQYRKWLISLGAAGLLTAVLLGRGQAAPGAGTTAPAPKNAALWGVTLGVDRVNFPAVHGTPAVMHATLTFFNRSATPLKVMEHGQAYNWQILDDKGQVVWNYALGRLFPHYVRVRILTRGELAYTSDVPLQTQAGVALAPGHYTLRGTVNAVGASASVGFTVAATPVTP